MTQSPGMDPAQPLDESFDEDVYRHVGSRLRYLRKSKGLRQAELADVLGISAQQYQKYEDARSRCSLANLLRLAEALDVGLSSLLPPELRAEASPTGQLEEAPAPSLAPPDDAQGQVARLIVAFLAIDDSAARQHLLGLAERLASSD